MFLFDWVRSLFYHENKETDISFDIGTNPLVWSRKTESILWHRYRTWSQRMGASKTAGRKGRKLPAVLMPEQASFVFKRRRLSERDVLYRDLASKNFVVGSACRYGGDFVVYEDHPTKCHSRDTIRLVGRDESISCADLAGFARVQGSVLKRAVFATIDEGRPIYVAFAFNATLSTGATKKLERRVSKLISLASTSLEEDDDEDDEDLVRRGQLDDLELALNARNTSAGHLREDDDDLTD